MATSTRKLTVEWKASRYVWKKYDGVRIRIEVVAAENMPADVFAFRMRPINPATGEAAGFFSHVCSPPDLAEYPAREPRPEESPQWFRLDYVDVLLRSMEEMEAFLVDTIVDLRRLKRTLDIMDTLTPAGMVVIDDDGTSSSSSSLLSSDSSLLSSGSA